MIKPFVLILLLVIALYGCGDGQNIHPQFSTAKLNIAWNGRLVLEVETNLPDGTKVNTWIGTPPPDSRPLYTDASVDPRQWDVVVRGGHFRSWFPSIYEKGIKAGQYVVTFGVLPDQEAVLGPKNKRLTGPNVEVLENGQRLYSDAAAIELPDLPSHGPLVVSSFALPRDTSPKTIELVDSVALALADKFPGLVRYSSQMDCIGVAEHEVHLHSGEWRDVVTLEFVVWDEADLPPDLSRSRGHHIFVDIGVDGKTLAVNKQAAVSLLLDKPFDDVPKFLDIPL
ncbi:hypothetical protein [Pseudodesulfovibrio indicus]|uniref:DUF4382 domain-containing protein n=1 Tax=Pseudodesulfovibrio indicus TaxID=1716143 RepID=A0A140D8W8_9BACT|nr:hypothetical protein [Pseudodesulfovibrio indicus]AMK09635.1 hypothetical protein AWY79_00180 [Pseudodesulfovibrio indicus]TDT86416.1 hypothetical protein EDC59_11392 [Pseudodesulfovibrio indicus]